MHRERSRNKLYKGKIGGNLYIVKVIHCKPTESHRTNFSLVPHCFQKISLQLHPRQFLIKILLTINKNEYLQLVPHNEGFRASNLWMVRILSEIFFCRIEKRDGIQGGNVLLDDVLILCFWHSIWGGIWVLQWIQWFLYLGVRAPTNIQLHTPTPLEWYYNILEQLCGWRVEYERHWIVWNDWRYGQL